MDEPDIFFFAVFYKAEPGIQGCGTDYALMRAEDEEHALEKFRNLYPNEIVTEVVCRGYAY